MGLDEANNGFGEGRGGLAEDWFPRFLVGCPGSGCPDHPTVAMAVAGRETDIVAMVPPVVGRDLVSLPVLVSLQFVFCFPLTSVLMFCLLHVLVAWVSGFLGGRAFSKRASATEALLTSTFAREDASGRLDAPLS